MEVLAGHASPHSPVSRYEDGGRGPLVEPFAPDEPFVPAFDDGQREGAPGAFGGRGGVATAHEPGLDSGYDLDNEGELGDEDEYEDEDEEEYDDEGYGEEDDEGDYHAGGGHLDMRQQQDAGEMGGGAVPTMDLGLSAEDMEGMGGMLSDVANLKDELAKQMLTITQEVARVQVSARRNVGPDGGGASGGWPGARRRVPRRRHPRP